MEHLDLKDRKILYQLEKNSRISVSDIARKVTTSKQLVSYKIKRLEERGIIRGYHAIIDTSKLGYTTYRVYLKFKNLTTKKKEEIIKYLTSIDEVTILLTINGLWDVGCAIMVKGIYEFYEVWEKIMKYAKFIDTHHVSVYSPIYHFTRSFLNPDKPEKVETYILGGKEKVDFDDFDIKILALIAPNVRRPLIETAEKLHKSLPFVISRLKLLEKKEIIQGYRPILNWDLLGYGYYKVDISLSNREFEKEIFNFCKSNSFIFQVDKTIGGSDLEIEIYAKSLIHFRETMQEMQDRFYQVFKNYNYFTLDKTYKETFFPL